MDTTVTAVNYDKPPTPKGVSPRGSNTSILDIIVDPTTAANVTAYRFEYLTKDEYEKNNKTWVTAKVEERDYKAGS